MGRQSWGASHGEPLQRLREIGISGWPQESCGALWGMKFFNAREKSEHEVRGGGGVGRREKRAKQRKPHTTFPFCVGVQFSREFISAFNHQIELQEQIQGCEQPKLNLVE